MNAFSCPLFRRHEILELLILDRKDIVNDVTVDMVVCRQWTWCLQTVDMVSADSGYRVCRQWTWCLQTVDIVSADSGYRVCRQWTSVEFHGLDPPLPTDLAH
jgi:hypothetical protein